MTNLKFWTTWFIFWKIEIKMWSVILKHHRNLSRMTLFSR